MLKTHFAAVEANLLTRAGIQNSVGHSLHKGTPREIFIREFLQQHLSERVAIGTGEVIDCNSLPGEQRNQIDIVIYKRDYPRLHFEGGINAFLAESVAATIEIKSTLTEDDIENATETAKRLKALTRHIKQSFKTGYHPPSILCYVVAYAGPAQIETVHSWISRAATKSGFSYPELPLDGKQREGVVSPGLDAVFVLGKGFACFENVPIGLLTPEMRTQHPAVKWSLAECDEGSLLVLFLLLTAATSGIAAAWLDPFPYLKSFSVKELSGGD